MNNYLDVTRCKTLAGIGQWRAFAETLMRSLSAVDSLENILATQESKDEISEYLEHFLTFFCREDFAISNETAIWFLRFNALISNLAEGIGLTDKITTLIETNCKDPIKKSILLSPRTSDRIDQTFINSLDPSIRSAWLIHFFDSYLSALGSETCFDRFQKHLRKIDSSVSFEESCVELYYGSTYVDPDYDRVVKGNINSYFRNRLVQNAAINDKSQKIAVVTACFSPGHSVYRNQKAYMLALKQQFDVVLFALEPNQDPTLASEMVSMHGNAKNYQNGLKRLSSGEFRLIYYPDIGMHPQSIILANQRLAPAQLCSYGHSVSTFGSQIDYYICGRAVEDANAFDVNYSERPLVISGHGIIHERPLLHPEYNDIPRSYCLIACPWSPQKCNYKSLQYLKRIADSVDIPVKYRFLTGPLTRRHQGVAAFTKAIKNALGTEDRAEIFGGIDYGLYLKQLSECDFSLDAFHFGGCNSVFDSLLVGKPIITWQGSKWYNRIGSQMLRELDLGELIANDASSYCEIAIRLVKDQKWKNHLRDKIRGIDLPSSILCSTNDVKSFVYGIKLVFENHATLKLEDSNTPIYV